MKKNSWVSLVLSLVLVVGLLAACSGGNDQQGSQNGNGGTNLDSGNETSGNNNEAETTEELEGSLITKDPLELDIHFHYANRFAFDNEWAVFKKAAELTNVSLNGTAPATGTDSNQMFNLMLAGGELPDIIHFYYTVAHTHGPDGVLIDLKDLINEHAPNIKKTLEENPVLERFATTPDGSMYYVPTPSPNVVAKGWLIRQDWLDALGLPVPVTYEDYYETLKAFKNEDPNGNGKNDEVPYFSREKAGIKDLLVFWGLRSTKWMAEDGKVNYSPTDPKYRTAVENIAKWYKEGLIDQEIFSRGAQAREILLGDNVGGSTHDWMQSTTGFNDSLKDQIPGFKMVAMAPPQNIHGKHVEETAGSPYGSHAWGISSTSKHPVEAIKYFDFWFSEEGSNLATYGVEGVTYTMENGEIDLTDEIKDGNILENLYKHGAFLEYPHISDPDFARFQTSVEAKKGMDMYLEEGYMMDLYPSYSMTEEVKEKYSDLGGTIGTYVDEMFQKWVMGAETLDDAAWDKYLAQINKFGLDELLEIEQAAYDSATE